METDVKLPINSPNNQFNATRLKLLYKCLKVSDEGWESLSLEIILFAIRLILTVYQFSKLHYGYHYVTVVFFVSLSKKTGMTRLSSSVKTHFAYFYCR